MSYAQIRDASIRAMLDRQIRRFVAGYQSGRPSIILVPGGTGSRLHRSHAAYTDTTVGPLRNFRLVWMAPSELPHNLPSLRVGTGGRDAGDHVIVPDDVVENRFQNPYDDIERRFAATLQWNFAIFAYDWRRSLAEWAGYLEYFLAGIARLNKAAGKGEPRTTLTLVGFSLGGLVTTLLLHRLERNGEKTADWLHAMVTVGTPFYGTSRSLGRYYKGDPFVARATRLPVRDVAVIISSMLPPYAILHPDRDTYERDADALAQTRYTIHDYPMHDEHGGAADPYDPAFARRFPPWVDTGSRMTTGRDERSTLTAPLSDATHARMFHVRSGRVDMPVEQSWRDIDGRNFDPAADDAPVDTVRRGPGDDRVPAWAARHVHTPTTQVYDTHHARKHGVLIEHPETHQVIEHIARLGVLPAPEQVLDLPFDDDRAPIGQTLAFLENVGHCLIGANDEGFRAPGPWHRFVDEITW